MTSTTLSMIVRNVSTAFPASLLSASPSLFNQLFKNSSSFREEPPPPPPPKAPVLVSTIVEIVIERAVSIEKIVIVSIEKMLTITEIVSIEKIVLSKPIIRHDNGKANLAIRNVNKPLSALQSECIENDNISSQHLVQKGLHLNPKGKARLALNFMKQIRKF